MFDMTHHKWSNIHQHTGLSCSELWYVFRYVTRLRSLNLQFKLMYLVMLPSFHNRLPSFRIGVYCVKLCYTVSNISLRIWNTSSVVDWLRGNMWFPLRSFTTFGVKVLKFGPKDEDIKAWALQYQLVNNGITCILWPMERILLNIQRLAPQSNRHIHLCPVSWKCNVPCEVYVWDMGSD